MSSPPQVAMRSSVPLYLCLLLCACLGVACVAGVCVWNSQWHGGFAWDDSGLKFNWHPVLMVSGLVVVYGFGEYGPPSVWGERGLVVVYGFGEYGEGLIPSVDIACPQCSCRVGVPEQGA